jgi:23S rRNA pseudouridine1911/1915/1917 synthase
VFSIADFLKPEILADEKDFLLVYKPPRMHSAPQARAAGETILAWCAIEFPEILKLPGRRAGEGGLLHRLDYETHGLMLVARNLPAMEVLLEQQGEEKILKEYSAVSLENGKALPGFPGEKPELPLLVFKAEKDKAKPVQIKSAFRPYGPGRKSVRPVLLTQAGTGRQYTTEILETGLNGPGLLASRLRIRKGFRHQIRSHLAWLGLPILNDSLYGGSDYGKGFLALRAFSVSFINPLSRKTMRFSIPPIGPDDA